MSIPLGDGAAVCGQHESEAGSAAHVEEAGAVGYAGGVQDGLEQRAVVRLGQVGPGLGSLGSRVHPDLAELAQVDHDAAVAGTVPGHRVAAAPDGDQQVVGARVADGFGHLVCGPGPRDQGRPTVVHGVPDGAGGIVPGFARADHLASESWNDGGWHNPSQVAVTLRIGQRDGYLPGHAAGQCQFSADLSVSRASCR
jgi:hypothetical protein